MVRLFLLSLLLASAAAFQTSLPSFAPPKAFVSTTARPVILSEAETEAILKSAAECAEGECSVDDVASLIKELKEQEKVLEARLETIMNMVAHLQETNEKKERKRDEVKAFVKDMLRVFNHDTPNFAPMGYAGDVGKGSQTAYDVLPPKKWKPTA